MELISSSVLASSPVFICKQRAPLEKESRSLPFVVVHDIDNDNGAE